MYFVVEWRTRSNPSSIGRWRIGVANVLSTSARAPASRAIRETAARSTIFSSGLDGVSAQTSRVFARTAQRTAPGSAMSTIDDSSPQRGRYSEAIWKNW